jgi:hypothetical protein
MLFDHVAASSVTTNANDGVVLPEERIDSELLAQLRAAFHGGVSEYLIENGAARAKTATATVGIVYAAL